MFEIITSCFLTGYIVNDTLTRHPNHYRKNSTQVEEVEARVQGTAGSDVRSTLFNILAAHAEPLPLELYKGVR